MNESKNLGKITTSMATGASVGGIAGAALGVLANGAPAAIAGAVIASAVTFPLIIVSAYSIYKCSSNFRAREFVFAAAMLGECNAIGAWVASYKAGASSGAIVASVAGTGVGVGVGIGLAYGAYKLAETYNLCGLFGDHGNEEKVVLVNDVNEEITKKNDLIYKV